jgi:hypothetical protein
MLRDGTIDVQHLGRVDAVPWADRIGGDRTAGSIEICSPNESILLHAALNASEN